jgi:hypothetical protein
MEEMVHGEQLLRRTRLRGLIRSQPLAGVLISPRMEAKLQLTVVNTETSNPLLGLLGAESTRDVIANIRLRFEVRPAPGRVPVVMPECCFFLRVPPFLKYRRFDDTDHLDFLGLRHRWLTARFSPAGELEIYDEEGELLSTGESYSVAGLVTVLDQTARWLREGATGEARRFNLQTQGAVGELMRRIAGYQEQVFVAFEDMAQGVEGRPSLSTSLEDLSALDCSYEITDVHARVLIQLDGEGKLIETSEQKSSEDWQQLDFDMRLRRRGELAGFEIAIRPPDFLVQGNDYHGKFLEALETDAGREILWSAFEEGTREAFDRFLQHPAQSETAVLVRVDGRDHDLVLLSGPLGGHDCRLLFLVKFDVTEFPRVEPTVVSARFLALEQPQGRWLPDRLTGEPAAMIDRYLTRVFRTAAGWLRAVVP